MKKFRNWLIHKLGGYTKEDVERLNRPLNYILSESKRQVQRIYSVKKFFDVKTMPVEFEDEVKTVLLNGVLDELKKNYKPKIEKKSYDDGTQLYTYKMVFEYLVPREDKSE